MSKLQSVNAGGEGSAVIGEAVQKKCASREKKR